MGSTDAELEAIRARMLRQLQEEVARSRGGAGPIPGGDAAAMVRSAPVDVGDADFEALVGAGGLVLVDLWAPWCGPCRVVGPIVKELAAERAGRLTVAKVNVDKNPRTSERFQVQGIPTLLLFKDGRLVDRVTGALPKPHLEAWLDRHA